MRIRPFQLRNDTFQQDRFFRVVLCRKRVMREQPRAGAEDPCNCNQDAKSEFHRNTPVLENCPNPKNIKSGAARQAVLAAEESLLRLTCPYRCVQNRRQPGPRHLWFASLWRCSMQDSPGTRG